MSKIPGRKVPQGGSSAFVPIPVPPKLDGTPQPVGAFLGICGHAQKAEAGGANSVAVIDSRW